jgi:hypothetical protein
MNFIKGEVMKKILKISVVLSLMLFGGSLLEASSVNSSKSIQHQGHFKSILEAEDFVQVAAKLDKTKTQRALALLSKAKVALQKAPVSTETKELNMRIGTIEKAIKSNKKTGELYSNVIGKFDAYINKVKQWGYEIRAHNEELMDVKKFKTEEKGDVF